MWQYQHTDELYHWGVKGMKWGRRRAVHESALSKSSIRTKYDKARSGQQNAKDAKRKRDAAIQDNYFKTMENIEKNYKRGQSLSSKDYKREEAADSRAQKAWKKSEKQYQIDKAKAKADFKQIKKERKLEIEKTHDKINKQTKLGEKILFNNATRKRAAQLVTDYNMPISRAKKAANKEAVRNTIIAVTAIAALNIGTIKEAFK